MNGEAQSASTPRRRFHLKKRIGAGAFGEVFLAEQDSGAGFRRPVALKVLNSAALKSKDAARRMRDEARILGRLSHRNIVGVLDLVRLGDRWAVVMDYVEGADIEQVEEALLEGGAPFPPAAALEVGACVYRALHAAYHADDGQGGTLKVVHRDIKPSNIRLTVDGEVKVLDFGVARVELGEREAKTKAEGWIGTERYMAPERILMEGDGPWGDVYATGASIIEMILVDPLGRTPVLEDRHQTLVDAAIARVRDRLAGPPEVVERTCSLLAASVAADPTKRPTAERLADELADLARKLEGETLAQFSRRFIPKVPLILGTTVETVDGVLSEGTELPTPAITSMPEPAARSAEPTLADLPDDKPTSTHRLVLWGALAAVGLVLLGGVVVGGGALAAGAFWTPSEVDPTTSSAPPSGEPAVTAPTPADRPAAGPTPSEPLVAPPPSPPDTPPTEPKVEPATRPTEVQPRPPTVGRPKVNPPPPVSSVPPPVPADGPQISAAAFAVQDADAVTVTCGGVTQAGTASVRLREFPAGNCTIQATYLGKTYTATVDVQRRSEVRCAVTEGRLVCGS